MTDLNNYREILDEALDIAKNIATDYDLETVDIEQAIDEICDGHRFVIYTSNAFQLVATTRNQDFDTFSDAQDYGLELAAGWAVAGENRSLDDLMTYMAFATMHELVRKQYFLLQDEAA